MPESLLGVETAFDVALILGDWATFEAELALGTLEKQGCKARTLGCTGDCRGNNAAAGEVRPKDEPALSELETAGEGLIKPEI